MDLDLLIVDDDEDLRAVLVDSAEALGYRAEAVASAAGALARASTVRYAAMLVDWSLGDMDGAELARALTAAQPHARVMLMTGHVFTPDTGHPVLRKPFNLQELGDVLRLATRGDAR